MNNNKGFTLIEMLGTFVILGILMSIAVGAYTIYRRKATDTSYELIEKNAISAAENYFMDNTNANEVYLHDLVDESYLETIYDPDYNNETCDGKVTIINTSKANNNALEDNEYMINLKCKKYQSCKITNNELVTCSSDDGITTTGESKSYFDTGIKNSDLSDEEITYAIRVKFNSFTNNEMRYFGNWELGGGGLSLNSGTNNFIFSIRTENNSNYVKATANLAAQKNRWYIVVGSYSNGSARIYVDGRLYATKSLTGKITPSTQNIVVGANPQPTGNYLHPTNISVTDLLVLNKGIDASAAGAGFSDPKKPINYTGDGIVYKKSFYYEEG